MSVVLHRVAQLVSLVLSCDVLASCASTNAPAQPRPADTSTTARSKPVEAPQSQPSATAHVTPPRQVHPFDGVVVFPEAHEIRIEAVTCLTEGMLEQVACAPNTREHESLVVTRVKPSEVHAALLLAGLEPGAPGQWMYEEDSYRVIPPRGDAIDIFVLYTDKDGREVEQLIAKWIREAVKDDHKPLGKEPWIFGGSRFETNPEFMGPGEHYVADMTGSIIGLVTFGDEVVGYSRVLADQEDVQEPVFEVNTDSIPQVGTKVTLILRRSHHAAQ